MQKIFILIVIGIVALGTYFTIQMFSYSVEGGSCGGPSNTKECMPGLTCKLDENCSYCLGNCVKDENLHYVRWFSNYITTYKLVWEDSKEICHQSCDGFEFKKSCEQTLDEFRNPDLDCTFICFGTHQEQCVDI